MAVLLLFAAVTAGCVASGDPAYGVTFLYTAPIACAVVTLGRSVGFVLAALSLGLFIVTEAWPDDALTGGDLLVAASVRAATFVGCAVVVDWVVRRRDRLTRTLAAREAEVAQLAALRSALAPPALAGPPSLQVADVSLPADGVAAGDFYFAAEHESGSVTIVLGDVAGHGLAAAERATFLRLVLSTLARSVNDPAQLLALANTALIERQGVGADFATAICVCIDPSTRIVAWASAGHPQPYELDTGEPVAQATPGPPLGVTDAWSSEIEQIALGDDGGLLLYTDGLTEARALTAPGRSSGPLFGEEAVRRTLIALAGRSPREVVDEITRTAREFVGDDLADDMTVLAFRLDAGGQDGRASPGVEDVSRVAL
jgi:serine phosphatase RsbU (regulator of sigma subunit)